MNFKKTVIIFISFLCFFYPEDVAKEREMCSALLPAKIETFPAKPKEKPLNWKEKAEKFDSFIMNPTNNVLRTRSDGCKFFPSDIQGNSDELITYGPIVLGKILRNDDVNELLPSFDAFFDIEAGVFLNGIHTKKIEYWYLMNVNALAAGIIRTKLNNPKYLKMLRNSANTLLKMARRNNYNFNEQGYDFEKNIAWTNKDIYRQPDAIGGYAYVMLISYELLGDPVYLEEAKNAIRQYQSFNENPWYEIPSGAMACLAAARLKYHYGQPGIDYEKILHFVFDAQDGALIMGEWGGKEVNGLMRGWRGGDKNEAYSMESLVVPLYILPSLRYNTTFAVEVGKYILNLSANMRYFYAEYLPEKNQSRPDLLNPIPYERLSKEEKEYSPYACGDFGSNRSVYGGAYSLWLGEIIKQTNDLYILQINISKTDFLSTKSCYPTYLYYNPYKVEKMVEFNVGYEKYTFYETTQNKIIGEDVSGSVQIKLPPCSAQIICLIPSGIKSEIKNNILFYGGIEVDYDIN